jgi:hypothetical protein
VADSLSVKMVTEPFAKGARDMSRRVDRASMWAVREAGRRLKREAMKRAPRKSGALRSSVHSSRRFKQSMDGSYAIKVGPRGGIRNPQGASAHLYAAKQEDRTHFMHDAYEATVPELSAMHAKAWQRAMTR